MSLEYYSHFKESQDKSLMMVKSAIKKKKQEKVQNTLKL